MCTFVVRFSFLSMAIALAHTPRATAQGSKADYERAAKLERMVRGTTVGEIKLHWVSKDVAWFVRETPAERSIMLLREGRLQPAFDHERLTNALKAAIGDDGKSIDARRLDVAWLSPGEDASLTLRAADRTWRLNLETYDLAPSDAKRPKEVDTPRPVRQRGYPRNADRSSRRSPDSKWEIVIEHENIQLKRRSDGKVFDSTKDGSQEDHYRDEVYWAPDSAKFVVMRRRRGQEHTVHMVESAPKDQLQPKLFSHQYLKPGDKIPQDRPQLFHLDLNEEDAPRLQAVALDESLYPNPWSITKLHWSPSSQRFCFLYNQRGHQRLRLVTVQADTGESGVLVDETSETFLDYAHKEMTYYLDDSKELLWLSERDGWSHLYLMDARTGAMKRQITKGPWVIRSVDRVDVDARRVWFWAGGIYPGQDPYYLHYCRTDLDGQNLVVLTEGNGTHEVSWSPDGKYLIDKYSRVDLPPVWELRDAESGELAHVLGKSDWTKLLETGWKPPERMVFKGRDGETDIYGVLFRPTNFDPKKSYPVIESIYAGPHGSFCPKGFRSYYKQQALSELGFIVVKLDGMGTSHRSKAFHDVCWQNLGDSGFPDRIRWIRAAAATRPWMDLSRVGIYGGSAGGQSSTRAMLAHGDFYHVAVSDCGCHDNRMDKIWWNELWMGWPVGKHYAEQSNVTQAHRLQGKLLLVVGEMDRNVDPASTMQVIDALIKADKDFDMLVVPGGGHGVAETPYGTRRRRDFFVRHLLEVEPRWTPPSAAEQP